MSEYGKVVDEGPLASSSSSLVLMEAGMVKRLASGVNAIYGLREFISMKSRGGIVVLYKERREVTLDEAKLRLGFVFF